MHYMYLDRGQCERRVALYRPAISFVNLPTFTRLNSTFAKQIYKVKRRNKFLTNVSV